MTTYKTSALGFCACFLLMGFSSAAHAQAPSASFEELRSSLKLNTGESIQVTSQDGRTLKGRLLTISDQAIAVTVDGVRQEISESEVGEIRHRRPDKWWNGALIGLGVGAGSGIVSVMSMCGNDSECQFIATAALVPALSGIGAGVGALIDFAIKKHETVYAAGRTPTSRAVRVSPILSKDKKGVRVAFSF